MRELAVRCKPTSAPCKVIIAGPASPDAGCLPHCRQLSFLAQKWDLVALSSGPLQGGLCVCMCELANVSSVHLSSAFLLTRRALETPLPTAPWFFRGNTDFSR